MLLYAAGRMNMISSPRKAIGLVMSWATARERVRFTLEASPWMTAAGTLTISPGATGGSVILTDEEDFRMTFALDRASKIEDAETPAGAPTVEVFWGKTHLSIWESE
jgi:hypothetical protein